MYTANDIDKMLKDYGTGGASAPSSATYKPYTSSDINTMLKGYNINPQAGMAAKRTKLPNYVIDQSTIQQNNSQPKPQLVKPVMQPNAQPQVVQLQQPQANASREQYVEDYMKKHPNAFMGETGANITYTLNNMKPLKFAQNLMEAANPLKDITDAYGYLDNQAKAKAEADNAAVARLAELEERAKIDPSVLTSKEYFDAASKVSRINYANQALQQAIPDDKNSFKSVGGFLNKQSQQATNELLEGKTGLGKFATEAAIGAADLIGTVGMAGMLGVKPLDYLSVLSGAQAGQQALDNGESYDKAALAAASSAAITRGIESAGGFFGSWGSKAADSLAKTEIGKKVLSKVPQNVADWIAKAADTYIGKVAAGGLSEAAEGFTEYYAQGFINNLILDKDTPLSFKEAIRNAALEGTVGLAGMSISNINAPVTRVQEGVQIENPAQPEAVQGNILEPLETEIKAKQEREMQAGEALRVSGLVNNEAANKVNRRTRRAVDAMAKKIGVKVMFDSTLSGEQGSYDPDNREIHIALDSSDPIGVVMTHEITHRMKETSPEQYEQLKNLAFEIMQENGSYDNVLASVADAYGNDAALIEDEMVAHFTRVMTEDIATFERLAGVDRNLAQKLLDLLDELLRKAGWDNNANVALDSLFGDINPQRLQSVRNSWAQALQNADAGAAGSGARQQSIETLPDGRQYVKADRNIIQGDDPVEWVKQVYNFFDRELRNGYDVVVHSSDGHELIISDDTVGKAVYNKKDGGQTVLTKEEFRRKLEAATHIDQLAEVSKYHKSKPDNPDHPHDDIDGDWKYFTSFFEDSENGKSKYYRVEFSVMPKRKDIIYDITDFQKRKHPTITGSSSNSGGAPSRVLLNGLNITQPNSGVNNQSTQNSGKNTQPSRPLDPNAINRNRDILAPLREGMRRATAPHQPLTGSRQGGESAISHIGEEGAFDDVKTLLASATREHERRARAEKDSIATIATAEDLKRPRVNVQDVASASYRKLVDSGERVQKIAKATKDKVLYPLFNNAKQAKQTAQYNIGVAQTNLKGERIGKSVQEIIAPIKEKGDAYWNAFQDYVYHMHNIDSMTLTTRGAAVLNSFLEELEAANPILQGISLEDAQELRRSPQYKEVAGEWINLYKRIQSITNKPVFGKSMTAEQSREIAGQYLLNHPEFEDLAAEVVGYYRNIINNNVDAGLISAKERDILQQLYPNYVPVMTLNKDVNVKRNDRTARVEDVHKKREANNAKLMMIDEAMARRTLSSVAAQRRNLFGVRLLEQALINRGMVGRDVQSVEDIDIPYDMDIEEAPELSNGFRVWVDGQPAEMAVSNELMEAVNSIMPKQSDGNSMELLLGYLNNQFKKNVTSRNPFFLIRNALKDVQEAVFYTDQNVIKFFGNYGKAAKEMKNNGEMWQLYQAMGGTGNSYFDYGKGIKLPEEYKGIIGKVKNGLDKFEQYNLYVEQAPRLSEFISVIEKGGRSYENIQKALLAAADITTNFGRSGETGQKINRSYVPFFNPGVQGADKFVRNFATKVEDKQWGKLIAQASAAMLPALWNILWWGDDEEYDLLPDYIKDGYYLVKAGKGIWLRFPKGRAIMPFTNAAERAYRSAQGEEGAWNDYVDSSIGAVAPNNPFTDNLASPFIDAWNNKAWHGGAIVPQRLQGLEAGQQSDEKTDIISKKIGETFNWSPKKLNYIMDQTTGMWGELYQAIPGVTPKSEGTPLVNSFYTDVVTNNRLSGDFYDNKDAAERKFKTHYDPAAHAEYKVYNKASNDLSKYFAQERDINASDLSDKEKSDRTRELAKERNQFLLETLAEAQAARDEAVSKLERAGITAEDYAKAYEAQNKSQSQKDAKGNTVKLSDANDKVRLIKEAVPHLSKNQREILYEMFGITKSVW